MADRLATWDPVREANRERSEARFMEGRLGAALVEGVVTAPPAGVTWIESEAHRHRG